MAHVAGMEDLTTVKCTGLRKAQNRPGRVPGGLCSAGAPEEGVPLGNCCLPRGEWRRERQKLRAFWKELYFGLSLNAPSGSCFQSFFPSWEVVEPFRDGI